MTKREARRVTRITIEIAARRAGISPRTVRRYVRRGLVDENLTEADLRELRRIRRLTDLGINLAGVEVILRMRSRIRKLHRQLHALEVRASFSPRFPEMPETWTLLPVGEENEESE